MKKIELMEECRKRFSSPKIDKCMNLHIEALEKAYDAGYNNAIEKVNKWLETIKFEKDYIDRADYGGCFFKEEDFINDFNKMMKE
jgi:hypothetical protein